MKRKNLIIYFFLLLFVSCATSNPIKVGVMTTYMPSGTLKYYIRPTYMPSANFSNDQAYVMIDFSYQKLKRRYVSNAYVNFTVYNIQDAYIDSASFKFENKVVPLGEITVLDRNSEKKFLRVGTVLDGIYLEDVLHQLSKSNAFLDVVLDNKKSLQFIATEPLVKKTHEAFSK